MPAEFDDNGSEQQGEQEEAQQEPEIVTGEEDIVRDVILVTAQKRVEDQKEVPLSLTILDSEKLEIFTTAGVDIRFLSGRVPSLTVESSLISNSRISLAMTFTSSPRWSSAPASVMAS